MAYEFSQSVTVDATKVPGDLVDFPVLVNSTIPELRTVGNGGNVHNANGYDIVFSLAAVSNPTVLDFEIEKYDATTGEIVAWVKLPAVSSSVDTVFYIISGNTAVNTDQSNPTAVWNSDFLSVYHFKEDAGLVGTEDSTISGRDLTAIAGTPPTSAPVQINGGASFAAAGYYSNVLPTPQTPFNPFPFTLSGWIEVTSTPGFPPGACSPFGIQNAFNQGVWRVDAPEFVLGVQKLQYTRHGILSHDFNSLTWTLGDRVFVAITLDSLGTTATGFLGDAAGVFNFEVLTPVPAVFINLPPTNPGMGARDNSLLNPFIGLMDEVEFATADLGTDWLEAKFNNEFSPATFYALGPVLPFIVPPIPVIITSKIRGGGGVGILAYNVRLNDFDGCLIDDREKMERIEMYLACGQKPDCFLMSEQEWNDTPPGFKIFNPAGSIVLPDPADGDVQIFSFKVPWGYDGIILGQYHGFTGTGFVEGSGDITWRVSVGGANLPGGLSHQNRYLKDCANMLVTIGSSRQVAPVWGGIQLRTGNIVRYIVSAPNTSGSLPLPGVGRINAGLHGYFYPRGFRG